MSNMAKPVAGDGGSRQCIGSGQNLTADSTECRNIAQQATLLSLDSIVIGERHRKDMATSLVSRPTLPSWACCTAGITATRLARLMRMTGP
jgi:hypothetical protein